jgi:hypothetical protein
MGRRSQFASLDRVMYGYNILCLEAGDWGKETFILRVVYGSSWSLLYPHQSSNQAVKDLTGKLMNSRFLMTQTSASIDYAN